MPYANVTDHYKALTATQGVTWDTPFYGLLQTAWFHKAPDTKDSYNSSFAMPSKDQVGIETPVKYRYTAIDLLFYA